MRQRRFNARLIEHDEMLERRTEGDELLGKRRQIGADGQHAILRTLNHQRQLRRRETRVERVAHDADAHCAIPAFHVRLAVPGEHAEMVALRKTERAERAGQVQAPLSQLRIRYP